MASTTGRCGLSQTHRPSAAAPLRPSRAGAVQPPRATWREVERPLIIQANGGQPILAPRTEAMQGDPFTSLLRQRTIFMGGEVEDFGADALVSQLLLLDSQDQGKDIKIFINSPGEVREVAWMSGPHGGRPGGGPPPRISAARARLKAAWDAFAHWRACKARSAAPGPDPPCPSQAAQSRLAWASMTQ